jgi:hypothetical protein
LGIDIGEFVLQAMVIRGTAVRHEIIDVASSSRTFADGKVRTDVPSRALSGTAYDLERPPRFVHGGLNLGYLLAREISEATPAK